MTDPILAATTVTQLMAAVNEAYGWDYPVNVPPGPLGDLWATPIVVAKDPATGVLYSATATTDTTFGPGVAGTVLVHITTGGIP